MKTLAAYAIVVLALEFPLFAKAPAETQRLLDAWIKREAGGAAIVWVDADGASFFQAGVFDQQDPRPIEATTLFETGSITKVFTALLLAESERLGKVKRSDPAARYLLPPDDPAQAELAKITLLSLTTHTSGLPRLPSNMLVTAEAVADPYASYDLGALVAGFRLHGPTAVVGKKFGYSNFGVSILGEALGSAWGKSYADALSEHVLVPLGMNDTSLSIAGTATPSALAPGHVGSERVKTWTFLASAAAGGLRSSTRDMAKFLAAYLRQRTTGLGEAIEATLQPQASNEELGGHIGLGWMLSDDAERPVVWHNGATGGSHAFIAFNRKAGAGVVILANVQTPSEELGFRLLGAKPTGPKTMPFKGTDYPGSYPITPKFKIAVTFENGALYAQGTGQGKFLLRSMDTDRFAITGVAAEITFERDSEGRVSALVLQQNGRDQRAARTELPPPPKEVRLPPETLAAYVGVYPLAPAFVLTVSLEKNRLFAQASGQPKLAIFPSAKDEFILKAVDAQISFQRDSAGKVSSLTLRQGGQTLSGKRTR